MSGLKHTPGPWEVDHDDGRPVAISAPHQMSIPGAIGHIVRRNGIGFPSSATGQANARLIAAAPDLLEACEAGFNALYDLIQSEFATSTNPHPADSDPDVIQMRAAIAKARGGK